MTASIDLNADLGETVGGVPTADDEAMFAVISSANIATGGHAGDAASMRAAAERAARCGVAVGGHPSYEDAVHFGRLALTTPPEVLRAQLRAQLQALMTAGAVLRYVKPHGALYHRVIADAAVADAVASAVADVSTSLGRALPVLGMDGHIAQAAAARGLPFYREAFLDRGYLATGLLVPRAEPGAVLDDPDVVAARAVRLVTEGVVAAVDGTLVRPEAVSLCVHGDSPGAVAMARAVRAALDAAQITVAPPW